jgi:hypothetical protein
MDDNDKSPLSALSRSKIRSFDPPLASIGPAYPTQPLLPFFHPPIERAASGPRCCLDFDRRVDFAAICFGVVIDLHI